jgi:hypothetical protein
MFWATTATAAVMAQEMKKAVQGSRVAGAAAMAGAQMTRVKRASMADSAQAAARGKMPKRTPSPLAMWPAPVR